MKEEKIPGGNPEKSREIRLIEDGVERRIAFSPGESLLDALKNAGVRVAAPCGGKARCGKCKVKIGGAAPISQEEKELLSDDEISGGVRLACCQKAGGIKVYLNSETARVLTEGFSRGGMVAIDGEKGYGIAIDVGTTTIAAYLLELETGRRLAVRSQMNAQKAYGADVITRADFAQSEEGLKELSSVIRGQIGALSLELCRDAGIGAEEIASFCIVGNPIMLHIFAERPVNGIVRAPFTPDFRDALSLDASEILPDLRFSPDAKIRTLPLISGYVGADTVSAILACGLHEHDGIALLLDIGTNGEIVLGGKDGLLCCSAAAGPAFEGAHITCGMGASDGAVSKVRITDGWSVYDVIGNREAVGFCGSGLLDAVAQLLDCGAVDETGAFSEESPLIEDGKKEFVFTLSDGVFLTQGDIRQVQLAKSAIASGVAVLLKEMGIGAEKVDAVYLAGGFGNYLDSSSAMRIGLLSCEFDGKIFQAGNAAGAGAERAILSRKERETAAEIAGKCRYIELSQRRDFNDFFIDNMLFPEKGRM